VDLARCPTPDEPSFGYVKETGAFWYGSKATFDCYTGFQLEESHMLSCVLGDEVDQLVWQGEPSTCTEIPDPTSRDKEDEWNRILRQANFLRGTKGSDKLTDVSSTRVIIGALIGFVICVVIAVSIFIICRKERKDNRSPKIRRQEEAGSQTTGYHLAKGAPASTSDSKI
jgi:hypothetical protein